MIVAIHQPQYMPWAGYMNKIASSDTFVFLDTVQFKKNEWQNRNRIKTATGWQWLSVPVSYHYPERILDIRVNNLVRWGEKHWRTLVTNYSRAPYFQTYAGFFQDTFSRKWEFLSDLNIHIIQYLMEVWGLKTRTIKASQLGIEHEDPTGRLLAICRRLDAKTYLAGRDGPKYMNLDQFDLQKVRIWYQEFSTKAYTQMFEGFIPDLSSIDLLFNLGPEGKKMIAMKCNASGEEEDPAYECIGYRRSSG